MLIALVFNRQIDFLPPLCKNHRCEHSYKKPIIIYGYTAVASCVFFFLTSPPIRSTSVIPTAQHNARPLRMNNISSNVANVTRRSLHIYLARTRDTPSTGRARGGARDKLQRRRNVWISQNDIGVSAGEKMKSSAPTLYFFIRQGDFFSPSSPSLFFFGETRARANRAKKCLQQLCIHGLACRF